MEVVFDHNISLFLTLYIAASVSPMSPKSSTPRTGRAPRVEVHVTHKQPVDEFHPTVQELVDAGYGIEESIEAADHSENPEEALDYLLNLDGEGGMFQPSASVLAKEEHQDQERRELEFIEESQQEKSM